MFDPTTEKPIPLRDVPRIAWLPHSTRAKKVSVSTVFRWVNPGIRGQRLEVLRIGGTLHTSEERLRAFFERLTPQVTRAGDEPRRRPVPPRPPVPDPWGRRSRARVQAELDAAGIR